MTAARLSEIYLCPKCDLVARAIDLHPGESSRCPRCGANAGHGHSVSRGAALAIAATAAQLWLLMNVFPLVTMSLSGVRRETTLIGASISLAANGKEALAALVALTTVIAPAVEILVVLSVLSSLDALARAGLLGRMVRWYRMLWRWSMVDVFMLGCLVSIVKLAHLADIVVGPGLWACAALLPALAFLNAYAQPHWLFGWTDEPRIA